MEKWIKVKIILFSIEILKVGKEVNMTVELKLQEN